MAVPSIFSFPFWWSSVWFGLSFLSIFQVETIMRFWECRKVKASSRFFLKGTFLFRGSHSQGSLCCCSGSSWPSSHPSAVAGAKLPRQHTIVTAGFPSCPWAIQYRYSVLSAGVIPVPKWNKPVTGEMHPKKTPLPPRSAKKPRGPAPDGQQDRIHFCMPKKVNNAQCPESAGVGEEQSAFLLPKVLRPNRRCGC